VPATNGRRVAGRAADSGSLAIRKKIADRLVFAKLRARTGGRIRFFVSGPRRCRPTSRSSSNSAGLPIIEGYGLTESSPVLTLKPARRHQARHRGSRDPRRGAQDAQTARSWRAGRTSCRATSSSPRRRAKRWMRTGGCTPETIGELDSDGYLKITDRRKELPPRPRREIHRAAAIRHVSATRSSPTRSCMATAEVPDHSRRAELHNLERWAASGPEGTEPARSCWSSRRPREMEREVMGTLRDLANSRRRRGRAARERLYDRVRLS